MIKAAGAPVVAITEATTDQEVDSVEAVAGDVEHLEAVEAEEVVVAPGRKTRAVIAAMLPPAEIGTRLRKPRHRHQ